MTTGIELIKRTEVPLATGALRSLRTRNALQKRVAGYARASTVELADGHTMETQEQLLRAWAEREGWAWCELYADAGISGRHAENRPALQRLLDDARAGMFDAVLVRRRDRLGRNLADVAVIERELQSLGIQVLSHDEPTTNEATPAGFLTKGLMDVLAHHYSLELAAKVASGWRTRAGKGLLANAPFGYAQEGDPRNEPPTVVPEEADSVRWSFEQYATGRVSMVDIADELNRRGFRTRYRARRGTVEEDGRFWTSQSVSALLANGGVYAGYVKYHGELLPGRHEAVVAEELWHQVDRIRAAARGRPAAPRRDLYLLRGLVRCVGCGSTLQGNHGGQGKVIRYYRETAARRGIPCAKPQLAIRADVLEGEVDALVGRLQIPVDVGERVREMLERRDGVEDVEAERRRVQEQLRRLGRLYQDLQVGEEEYLSQRRALEARLDALVVPTEQAVAAVEHFDVLKRAWRQATPEERRSLVVTLIEAVWVDMERKAIVEIVLAPTFRPWLEQAS